MAGGIAVVIDDDDLVGSTIGRNQRGDRRARGRRGAVIEDDGSDAGVGSRAAGAGLARPIGVSHRPDSTGRARVSRGQSPSPV